MISQAKSIVFKQLKKKSSVKAIAISSSVFDRKMAPKVFLKKKEEIMPSAEQPPSLPFGTKKGLQKK